MSQIPCCIRAIPYESVDGKSLTMCLYMDTNGERIPDEIYDAATEMFKNYNIEFVDLPRRSLNMIVSQLPPLQKRKAKELADLSTTVEKNLHLFENRMNVTAVQASYKVTDSIEQNIPCVTVYVLGKGKIPAGETDIKKIKEENGDIFDQAEFDVVEGYYKLTSGSSLAGYTSPLEGGVAIGVERVHGTGTLGGFLEDEEGNVYILSNEHVLHPHEAGDEKVIVQPSESDYKNMKKAAEECFNEYAKKAQNMSGLENLGLQSKEFEEINKTRRSQVFKKIEKMRKKVEERLNEIEREKPRPIGKYVYGLKDNFTWDDGHEIYVDAAIATLNETELSDIEYHKIEVEDKTNRCPLYGFETNKYRKTGNYKPPNGEIIDFESLNMLLCTEDSELHFMKIGQSTGFTNEGFLDTPVHLHNIYCGDISRLIGVELQYCEDCIQSVPTEINPNPKRNEYNIHEECAMCQKKRVNRGEVKSFWARNCFAIRSIARPFSVEGDSGALVFDSDGRAWGLLFGVFHHASEDFSLMSPLAVVLHALGKQAGKFKLW